MLIQRHFVVKRLEYYPKRWLRTYKSASGKIYCPKYNTAYVQCL